MRVLITGVSGCAGSHLVDVALGKGATVGGLAPRAGFPPNVRGWVGDIRSSEYVENAVREFKPGVIFHLAALIPKEHGFDASRLVSTNVTGTYHILNAARRFTPTARVLIASSGAVYGRPADTEYPIDEKTAFRPRSLYGTTKVSQEFLAQQFHGTHGLHTVIARTFNQTGPREPDGLVTGKVVRQIARIERVLQEPIVRVWDLRPSRDFTDVRDVVAAYWLAAEYGTSGEAYNVCSGTAISIADLVATCLSLTDRKDIRVVEERMEHPDRPSIPFHVGDPSKLMKLSGWRPSIPLHKSLEDLLMEARLLSKPARSDG